MKENNQLSLNLIN